MIQKSFGFSSRFKSFSVCQPYELGFVTFELLKNVFDEDDKEVGT